MTKATNEDEKWLKELLRKELRQYKETISDITEEEKRELKEWVASGHSPYENPFFLHDDSGRPMDYIAACRISAEMAEDLSCSSRWRGQEGLGGFQDAEEDIAF
jgi:hypothetical protein